MAAVDDFTTYREALTAALAAHDIADARHQLLLARSVLPSLPRVSSDGTSVDYESARLALNDLERAIRQSDTGGVVFRQAEF